jgi:regulatory protein
MVDQSATEAALRALRHRDLTAEELRQKLALKGFEEDEREEAIDALLRTGLLDDRRFAEGRARSLARRGAGDRLIRYTLERAGVERQLVAEALEALDPEAERARNVVARRGRGQSTARYLRGKGFSDEVVAAVVADLPGQELG